MLSRLCEEGLASSVADAARQPINLALEILEMRAYARARVVLRATPERGAEEGLAEWATVMAEIELRALHEAGEMG